MGLGIALRGSGWPLPRLVLTERAREVPVCPVDTYQYHISIPEVPTPLGLLSSLSGIAVSSRSISRYLGRALVARGYTGAYLFSTSYLFSST